MSSNIKLNSLCGMFAIAGILGLCTACDVHGSIELNGSNHGHIHYKSTFSYGWSFMIVGTPDPVQPEYTIDVDGYPYNRVLITGNLVSRDANGNILASYPIQLGNGSVSQVTITIAGFTSTYNTTIRSDVSLPNGTYILDAPGIVQDVQAALLDNPGSNMTITTTPLNITKALPGDSPMMSVVQDQIGNNNVTINFPVNAMIPWAALETIPAHPPIQHPEP